MTSLRRRQFIKQAGLSAAVLPFIVGLPTDLTGLVATGVRRPGSKFEDRVLDGAHFANATLDGAPGPEHFVHDLRAGFSARYKRWRLTYTVIDRSAEFDVPAGAIENQRFGSFALTFEPFTVFK